MLRIGTIVPTVAPDLSNGASKTLYPRSHPHIWGHSGAADSLMAALSRRLPIGELCAQVLLGKHVAACIVGFRQQPALLAGETDRSNGIL